MHSESRSNYARFTKHPLGIHTTHKQIHANLCASHLECTLILAHALCALKARGLIHIQIGHGERPGVSEYNMQSIAMVRFIVLNCCRSRGMNCLMMKRVVGEVGVQVTAPTGWRIHFALTRQLSEFHKTETKPLRWSLSKRFMCTRTLLCSPHSPSPPPHYFMCFHAPTLTSCCDGGITPACHGIDLITRG